MRGYQSAEAVLEEQHLRACEHRVEEPVKDSYSERGALLKLKTQLTEQLIRPHTCNMELTRALGPTSSRPANSVELNSEKSKSEMPSFDICSNSTAKQDTHAIKHAHASSRQP